MTTAISPAYYRPSSLQEAAELIARPRVGALAGGTDLVLMRSSGLVEDCSILDLKGIEALRGISVDEDAIRIGSLTTLDALARDDRVPHAIADGAAVVGGWQTRTRATIGGNVCRASPAADTLCGLLVNRARFHLTSVRGDREVEAKDFFVGPGKTVRAPDEILTRIAIARRPRVSAYQRFTYRNAMDLAVAGVGVMLEMKGGVCADAAVAIAACGPRPLLVDGAARALLGTRVDTSAVEAACAEVLEAAQPIDDVRGTREHRMQVLAPLARRVMAMAMRRSAQLTGEQGV